MDLKKKTNKENDKLERRISSLENIITICDSIFNLRVYLSNAIIFDIFCAFNFIIGLGAIGLYLFYIATCVKFLPSLYKGGYMPGIALMLAFLILFFFILVLFIKSMAMKTIAIININDLEKIKNENERKRLIELVEFCKYGAN